MMMGQPGGRVAVSNRWGVVLAAMTLTVAGCAGDDGAEPAADEPGAVAGTGDTIPLPAPGPEGTLSLEEAVAGRRSARTYTEEPLTQAEISLLLWAAQGITEAGGAGRAAPSAGGTYPLEVFLLTAGGSYHYVPDGHHLEVLGRSDLRAALAEAALGQEWVEDGAAVIVITGVFARTEERYGDRAERYVHLEAGHAAQNVLLEATALGLGAVPVGAFRDGDVQAVLGIPADHVPLEIIPVGRPPTDG
jgi:SagB-type dehydrogenase family enzyme